MKNSVYSSGDYAGLVSKNFEAYYGYEVQDENEEWCFQAKFNDQEITIPFSKLRSDDQFNCEKNLLIGVSWIFMKYKLTL